MTWREELRRLGIDVNDVVAVVPPTLDWDRKFDSGYGGIQGVSFVAWTADRVVLCICYDGAEWLETVPRNPDFSIEPDHFGGG